MADVANPAVTEAEYLALAEASEEKLEFVDGEIRMMAGGSESHGALQYRLARSLGPLIDARGCRGYASDTRIKVRESGQYVYPDLSAACPKGEFEGTSLLNPTLVVEALSPGTAAYDRGRRLELYLSIPTIKRFCSWAPRSPASSATGATATSGSTRPFAVSTERSTSSRARYGLPICTRTSSSKTPSLL